MQQNNKHENYYRSELRIQVLAGSWRTLRVHSPDGSTFQRKVT